MCCSFRLFPGLHDSWVFTPGFHGIWLICGHLQPSPLHGGNVPGNLHSAGGSPYSYSFLVALFHTILTFRLTYCHSNIINHFYCDDMPLLRLACSDTYSKQLWIFACAGIMFISSFLVVFVSYMYIISAILRMCSAEGRCKAFSNAAPTCWQSPYSVGLSSSCTYSQALTIPLTQIRWPQYSTQWSCPCWIL